MTTPAGGNAISYTPGATPDSGSIAPRVLGSGGPLLPLDFTNLGASGSVIFANAGAGRPDKLDLYGTTSDDRFDVNGGAGTVRIYKANQGGNIYATDLISTGAINELDLHGLGGSDIFNITGPLPYTRLDAEADAIYNVTGDGTAVTANLNGPTTTVTGGGLGTVVLTGNDNILNLDAGAGNVTVTGTAGPDIFTISPTGATTATILVGGSGTVLNTTNGGMLTIDPLGGVNIVIVNGTAASDVITATGGATPTVQVNSLKTVSLVAADVASLAIDGGAGSDTLVVNSTTAPFSIPITYDGGGSGSDSLTLTGGTALSDVYTPGPGAGAGSNVLTFGAGTEQIYFTNLSPVLDLVTGPLTINGTAADNAINYSQGSVAANGLVTIDSFESIEFSNKTTLTINAGAGSDAIDLNDPTAPTGLTGITINGGDPTASDTLTVNGIPGAADDITVSPTGIGSGSIVDVLAAFVLVLFTGVEHLSVIGQPADADGLRVNGTAGDDTFVVTPGAAADAGTITGFEAGASGFEFTPVAFSGIRNFLAVPNTSAGTDTLIVEGTSADDAFAVNSTTPPLGGSGYAGITVNAHTPIFFGGGLNSVVLRGEAGNDTFNLDFSTQDFSTLTTSFRAEGGESDATSDTLNYTAPADAATTIDLGASSISSTGTNPVTFSGIKKLNETSSGAGSTLSILGTTGPDTISYTPTGTTAGLVTLAGSDMTTTFAGVQSTFTINPVGGGDTVTVNGTAANDAIAATGAATPTVQVNGLKTVSLVAANVNSLVINGGAGSDTLTVNSAAAPFSIPITYDGGGSGSDSLTLTGGTALSDVYTPGPGIGAGSNVLTFGAGIERVYFKNLSPVLDLVAGPLTVNGTNADNAINYTQGSVAANGLVSIDNFESIEFSNKTTLTINAGAGNDTINLNDPTGPNGLTGITINGGDPTDSDTLIVNGTVGSDAIGFAPRPPIPVASQSARCPSSRSPQSNLS